MAQWKNYFVKYASLIDDHFDELVTAFKKRLRSYKPLQIVAYRSYGTTSALYIKGRVLQDKKIAAPTDKDTVLSNLLNMYKRFESDEVPGAVVQAIVGEETFDVTTDAEGYFVLKTATKQPIEEATLWHSIPL